MAAVVQSARACRASAHHAGLNGRNGSERSPRRETTGAGKSRHRASLGRSHGGALPQPRVSLGKDHEHGRCLGHKPPSGETTGASVATATGLPGRSPRARAVPRPRASLGRRHGHGRCLGLGHPRENSQIAKGHQKHEKPQWHPLGPGKASAGKRSSPKSRAHHSCLIEVSGIHWGLKDLGGKALRPKGLGGSLEPESLMASTRA